MTSEQRWTGTRASTQELKCLVEFSLKWFLPRVDFIISLGLRGREADGIIPSQGQRNLSKWKRGLGLSLSALPAVDPAPRPGSEE